MGRDEPVGDGAIQRLYPATFGYSEFKSHGVKADTRHSVILGINAQQKLRPHNQASGTPRPRSLLRPSIVSIRISGMAVLLD
jgi:hypothetical protein